MIKVIRCTIILAILANCACASPRLVIKVNELQLSPLVRMVSNPQSGLRMYYYNVRLFKQKIESRGNVEYVTENEPLAFDGFNKLKEDTETVGIHLYIENPAKFKYRLLVKERRGDDTSERIIYEGIREDLSALIKPEMPLPENRRSELFIEVKILDNKKIIGDLVSSKLNYLVPSTPDAERKTERGDEIAVSRKGVVKGNSED